MSKLWRLLAGTLIMAALIGWAGMMVGLVLEGGPGPIVQFFGSVLTGALGVAWVGAVLAGTIMIVAWIIGRFPE